ncbi:hypothetical protein CYMTET_21316 [Cymbomonas tetramitiformis]|uniref:RRM domain-containing protein n=1 Tax=Cymbomonas tetramitiformis TaxID=36881 RepID=A0AAE0G283_9CHLO|nr:hypothetical protein CYMTET_21316 [Cymbomonas tetramitiformis]
MSDSKTDVKVLLVGDVCGKINALAKRITSVNKSNGPFDCCFCVGSFFGDGSTSELQPYLDGKSTLPIPVYFIDGLPGGSAVLESVKEDGVIFPNLTFLRGAGIRDLHGLRVAYLAGRYDALSFADQSAVAANAAAIAGEYRVEDVKALTSAAEGGPNFGKPPVDLFLSNEWGKGILYASPTAPAEMDKQTGSPVVAELLLALQPRYHVAGTSEVFFSREPFRNKSNTVTRFIGLAKVGNSSKQKWIHALGLQPALQMAPALVHAIPAGSTSCPLTLAMAPPPPAPPAHVLAALEQDASASSGQYWRWEDRAAKQIKQTPSSQLPPMEGDAACRVFVRNLNYRATEAEITRFFRDCGPVVAVRIRIGEDGRPAGHAHVQFESAEAAEEAVMLTGNELGGAARCPREQPLGSSACWALHGPVAQIGNLCSRIDGDCAMASSLSSPPRK